MTDSNTPAVLVKVSTVTAQNIVAALGLEQTEAKVAAVEQALSDELAALQTHFALAVTDIQNSYRIALAEAVSAFSYVKANPLKITLALGGVVAVVFALGAVAGHFA
jgi:hypothetical protein